MRHSLAAIAGLGLSLSVGATPVSFSDTQPQTVAGQAFNFSFSPIPASGVDGRLDITIRGDLGEIGETAVVTLDGVVGVLDIGDFDSTTDGVLTNTIPGLSLLSSTLTGFGVQEARWDFSFDMTDDLLALVIGTGSFTATLDYGIGVNLTQISNPFAQVTLSYDSVTLPTTGVPEPATLVLLALGLLGVGTLYRRAS